MESLAFFSRRLPREDLAAGVAVSTMAHVLILSVAFIVPGLLPRQAREMPFYTVNLVSMKDLGGEAGGGPKTAPGKSASPAKTAAPDKASRPSADKAAPLVSVKRLQFDDTPPPRETAIKKLDSGDSPPPARQEKAGQALEKDLEKLMTKPKPEPSVSRDAAQTSRDGGEREVEDRSPPGREHTETQGGEESAGRERGSGAQSGSPAGEGRDGGQIGLARRLYYTEIWNAIRSQWALPEFLKTQKLEAVLIVTVRRDGKIMNVRFERQSGNGLFDESAMRAVRKADPLPPFPQIYSPPSEDIGVRFRPEDLG